MNLPLNTNQSGGSVDDRLLDRLVDGELPDAERRALLLRFENEPGGWRRCALAFLEAQNWREALRPLAEPATAQPGLLQPCPKPRSWRRLARPTGLAAGFALVFALGWGLRGRPAENWSLVPLPQQVGTEDAAAAAPPEPAPGELARQESGLSKANESPAALDPLVRLWEKRGYSAQTQKRLVSLELRDGRKVNLPVREIRFRYIGDRTY